MAISAADIAANLEQCVAEGLRFINEALHGSIVTTDALVASLNSIGATDPVARYDLMPHGIAEVTFQGKRYRLTPITGAALVVNAVYPNSVQLSARAFYCEAASALSLQGNNNGGYVQFTVSVI